MPAPMTDRMSMMGGTERSITEDIQVAASCPHTHNLYESTLPYQQLAQPHPVPSRAPDPWMQGGESGAPPWRSIAKSFAVAIGGQQ